MQTVHASRHSTLRVSIAFPPRHGNSQQQSDGDTVCSCRRRSVDDEKKLMARMDTSSRKRAASSDHAQEFEPVRLRHQHQPLGERAAVFGRVERRVRWIAKGRPAVSVESIRAGDCDEPVRAHRRALRFRIVGSELGRSSDIERGSGMFAKMRVSLFARSHGPSRGRLAQHSPLYVLGALH